MEDNEPIMEDYDLDVSMYEEYRKKIDYFKSELDLLESKSIALLEKKFFCVPLYFLLVFILFFVFFKTTNVFSAASVFITIFYSFVLAYILRLFILVVVEEVLNFIIDIFNNLKKKKKKIKEDREEVVTSFCQKTESFETAIVDYYEKYLQDFFEENLYKKRSGSEKFEKVINLFSEMINECEEINSFLINSSVYLQKHEDYLFKRQIGHYFSKGKDKNNNSLLKLHKKIKEKRIINSPEKTYATLRKIDWNQLNQERWMIGLEGEEIVLAFEKDYLTSINKQDLADKVCHVSVEKGDGAGYDILSFSENGTEKFIEVKSTKNSHKLSFNISRNELGFLERNNENSFIYQVSEVGSEEPSLKILTADKVLNSSEITPVQFIIKINNN